MSLPVAGDAPARDDCRTVQAVGIVVPALNEESHIGRCLRAVARSLEQLPREVAHAVCLVLDRCTDRTEERAARELARLSACGPAMTLDVVRSTGPTTVGELRDTGLRRTLSVLDNHPNSAIWLLSTDADTTVGRSWAADHLRHANLGADAVIGMADLDDPASLGPERGRHYARILAAGTHSDRHTHVYGANFGVRADAYLAAGGFPSASHGEDHQLHARLVCDGYRVVSPTDARVQTSARRHGRATGGLADLLRNLPQHG